MTKYFTADRSGGLYPGLKLDLFQKPQNLNRALTIDGAFDHFDLERLLCEDYPSGISSHGIRYLLNNENFIFDKDNRPVGVNLSPAIELYFESVRRAFFPERPSRFTCAFACETPELAQGFFNNSQLPVFEIQSLSRFFVADERFLKIAHNNLGSLKMAKSYWSGEMSSDPNPEVLIECPAIIGQRVC